MLGFVVLVERRHHTSMYERMFGLRLFHPVDSVSSQMLTSRGRLDQGRSWTKMAYGSR